MYYTVFFKSYFLFLGLLYKGDGFGSGGRRCGRGGFDRRRFRRRVSILVMVRNCCEGIPRPDDLGFINKEPIFMKLFNNFLRKIGGLNEFV